MKHLFTFLFSYLCVTTCLAQHQQATTLRASINFNIALNGLATNDAGVGLGLDASFFSKRRLQALIETSADRFIGDKLLLLDTITGKKGKSAAVYSIRVGPQLFVSENIALAATYGPSWHVVRDFGYTLDGGFKYSITFFFGKEKSFIAKMFMVNIPVEERKIQYLGIAAGFQF
ncbi:MAG TPA: hypothetical protein VF609_09780 [Flavisolibacter sp.]|jgi:hypothetical protein